jgi:hypothetical protein
MGSVTQKQILPRCGRMTTKCKGKHNGNSDNNSNTKAKTTAKTNAG